MTQQPQEKPDKKKNPRKRHKYGEGSVFERKDTRPGKKNWVAQIRLENGKKKQFYFETEKEAQRGLRQTLHDLEQGSLATGPQQKLKTYLEQWFEQVHKMHIRVGTYVGHRVLLYKHIIPALGHIQIQRLTAQKIQAFYTDKLSEGLSPGYVRLMHAMLHQALDNAVRWRLTSRNVCDDVSPPQMTDHEIHPLTIEQARLLLETAKGHRLEMLLLVALTTGMRHGELAGLQWHDVNFEDGSIQIQRSVKYITGHGFEIGKPKTTKSMRKIMLPAFVLERLREHQAAQEHERIEAEGSWQDHHLIFCTKRGGFLNPGILREQFYALLKKAGIPEIRIHDLRHSAATFLLSMGVNPKQVQEMLGHSHMSMTLGIYGHVLPSMQKEIAQKFNDLFQEPS